MMGRYICTQCSKRCREKTSTRDKWDDDIPEIPRPDCCPPENEPNWLRVV